MPVLELKNISKCFGDLKVLDEVSLALSDGELLVLLGSSGCGKTTLLRMIAGLETTDSGEIHLGAKRIDQLRPRDRQVAMVFQNYALYPHMSVAGNLAFPLKIAGIDKREIENRIRQTARMLGLEDRLDAKPSQLSGGQRQRVALGRAVIRRPELFLLDEPLSNLDAGLRARMRREIVNLQKELGVTTVYVTHDQTEALTMADRIAVLHEGKLLQVGSPEELYRDPAWLHVAEFIGQPKLNVITPADNFDYEHFGVQPDKSPVVMCFRPESVIINDEGNLAGTVVGCEYLGNQYILSIEYKGHVLVVSGCGEGRSLNQKINFSVEKNQVLFFDPESGERLR